MGLFDGSGHRHRMERRAERHAFKLQKKQMRHDTRRERIDKRAEKSESKDAANEVAYMNHMQPTHSGTLMGDLEGGAKLVTAVGGAVGAFTGAGAIGGILGGGGGNSSDGSGANMFGPGPTFDGGPAPHHQARQDHPFEMPEFLKNPMVLLGALAVMLLFMFKPQRSHGK